MIKILCGIPGSGKSTWCKQSLAPNTAVVLCADEFRLAMTGRDYYPPVEEFVWGCVKITARVLLARGMTVVIDETNITVNARRRWIQLAQEMNKKIECHYFDEPFDVCARRNRDREKRVPDSVLQRMHDQFEPPVPEEGFAAVYVHGRNCRIIRAEAR